MWLPLKNKKTKAEMLIMLRYTLKVSNVLFPTLSADEWERLNHPNNTSQFIQDSLARTKISNSNKINRALIATIDDEYLNWLAKKQHKHSFEILTEYLKEHVGDVDFWNQRLIDSRMTSTYTVLGIPCLTMLYNCNEMHTNYYLSKELTCEITSVLQDVFYNAKVFVPGWFLKGCDAPMCIQDITQLADIFWRTETRIRLGKFLEQKYDCYEIADRFSPLYFVIPFVVKTDIACSVVDLRGLANNQTHTTAQVMTSIRFPDEKRYQLFNLITQAMPYVISIGPNAVLPSQAYLSYHGRIVSYSAIE